MPEASPSCSFNMDRMESQIFFKGKKVIPIYMSNYIIKIFGNLLDHDYYTKN